jgi:large subunit ribosomal protein L18
MMKLKMNKHTSARKKGRLTKKIRIRKIVSGSPERPRLCVFRSSTHMYAQLIDDTKGVTLACASSLGLETKETGRNLAKFIGSQVAKKALELNIKNVVFDRNGYLYHGRVQALAEGAREGGLSF